jgi:hypothetical protein
VTSEADQYRRLARELHFLARNLAPGEERSAFLKMAEEWDRLADQLDHQTASTGIGDRPSEKARGGLCPDYDSGRNKTAILASSCR